MSTFIELVNDVARESGTMGGQSLSAVSSATGRWLKIVSWTRQAWELIQRERGDWTFLTKSFTASLVQGQMRYSAAELGISDFGGWLRVGDHRTRFTIYNPSYGLVDQQRLCVVPYSRWDRSFGIGIAPQARPSLAAYDDDRNLCIGNPPDRVYTITGHCRRKIQSLAADADTPYIDDQYHQAIVWRALMLLGDDDESANEVTSSANTYFAIRHAMIDAYTEQVSL